MDSVKFSGGFVAGLSLQSTRIMALSYSPESAVRAESSDAQDGMSNKNANITNNSTESANQTMIVGKQHLRSYVVDSTGIAITLSESGPTEGAQANHLTFVQHTEPDGSVSQLPRLIELVLPPRSLYILRGPWRYHYDHAILGVDQSPKIIAPLADLPTQRTSIIFRDIKL